MHVDLGEMADFMNQMMIAFEAHHYHESHTASAKLDMIREWG
jgi:hypothetical protein